MMDSFTIHRSYLNAMSCLPKSKHLAFLQMVISYGLDGKEPEMTDEMMPFFQLIKPNMDESNRKRKYLADSRRQKQPAEIHVSHEHTSAHDNAHTDAPVLALRNGIGKGNGSGKGSGIGEEGMEGVSLQKPPTQQSSSKRFSKPSVEEVAAYCEERQNGINAQKFVDHYETVGWVVGKSRTPMKDWRSAVRTWESRDMERRQEEGGQGTSLVEQYDPSKRTLKPLKPADAD